MNKILYSHNSDDWKTPKYIFDYYMKKGYIDLFAYKSNYDQFSINYKDKKLFCNPPYSKMNIVADYLIEQITKGGVYGGVIDTCTNRY